MSPLFFIQYQVISSEIAHIQTTLNKTCRFYYIFMLIYVTKIFKGKETMSLRVSGGMWVKLKEEDKGNC